jgi:DNA excision repair protein ERCC-2
VIRSEHDRGVVMLMDDRFGEARVQHLLPRWWVVD